MKQLRLQPSEIDRMEFYRLEYLIDNLKEYNDEEEKRHKEEERKQKAESPDLGKFTKNFNSMKNDYSLPKVNFPNYKL